MVPTDHPRFEQQERLFEAISATTPDFIYAFDLAGRFIYANQRLLEVWGTTFQQAIGKNLYELGYPTWHADMHMRELQQVIQTRLPIKGEVAFTGGSGISGVYEYIFSPILDVRGEVEVIAGTTRDVTDRKRGEERARTILESITDAFFAVDKEWRFTYVNQQAEKVLERSPGDLIGKSIWDEYPGLLGSGFETVYRRVARTLSAESYTAYYPDHQRWYEVHVYPAQDGISVYFRDVSEAKKLEDERRSLAQKFAAQSVLFDRALSSITDFAYTFDLEGRFTFVNKPLLDLWGLPLEQAVGKNFYDLKYPDDLAAKLQRQIQEVIQTRQRIADETRYVSPTGVEGWYQYIFSAIVGADGRVEAVAGSTRDISDRKRGEIRDRFLLALDSAVRPLSDPAEITATHARLLGEHLKVDRCAYADVEADQDTFNLTGDYNNKVPSIVGRYRFAQFGEQVLDLMRRDLPFVVDDVDTHQPPLGDLSAYRATVIQAVICVPLHKDGRFVAAMAVHQTRPRHWTREEVELVGYVAARCWESIERARVERNLRESEAQFRAIFEHSTAGIFQLDISGRFVVVNQWMCDLLGYERSQLLNLRTRDITHPDEQQGNRDLLEKAARDRQTFVLETRYICKHGAAVWVSISVNVVFDGRGHPHAILGIVTDLTDRRRAEEERQTLLESERYARAEAERASRMKDEFLATLSHELRTPLNAILGWAQILSGGPQSPDDVKEAVDIIERNARAQTQIIEDLLDMSRIISGKIRLDVQRVDLAAVVQAGIETVRPAADAKGVRLRAVLDPLAGFVSGDPNRLQQVFWNLLTNAVKFTSRGGSVQVVLERVNSHLEVNVIDTGEGITTDFLPYVFDRFRQAEGGTTRRHGGLGLGLAIVRQLVELHGGSVRVASGGPGKGATFSVLLPLTVLHPDTSPDEIAAQLRKSTSLPPETADSCVKLEGVKVLVVDDEPDARNMLKRFLEDCDAIVTTAASVSETLERLETDPPDVLVSDIGLPGEDGYSLIRKIRARSADRNKRLPAIALTAYARAEDRIKTIRAGFDMHVTKPVDPAELIAVIASLASRRQDGR